jgi:hypothetical protein
MFQKRRGVNTRQLIGLPASNVGFWIESDSTITVENGKFTPVNAHRIREHVIVENESTLVGCQCAWLLPSL